MTPRFSTLELFFFWFFILFTFVNFSIIGMSLAEMQNSKVSCPLSEPTNDTELSPSLRT